MEPYKRYFPHSYLLLPETEKLAKKILLLPTGTEINLGRIKKICGIIKFIVSHAKQIKSLIEDKPITTNYRNFFEAH